MYGMFRFINPLSHPKSRVAKIRARKHRCFIYVAYRSLPILTGDGMIGSVRLPMTGRLLN